jgi:serine-type D-Ala-D-Ala carboxypeptidase (penicillin-binding protein 5/6)
MTALIVLSSARLEDVVVVPPEAVNQIGSSIGLRTGERLTVRDLLYGMLLPSANDAAVALAVFVGGTMNGFVERMNATAARIGLRDSHFASPTGLDNTGYSTPRDLAALIRRAYRNETFTRVVRTVRRRIPGPNGTIRHLVNRNILLRVYPGAFGVKSGFTTPAGFCLAGAARLNGLGLLAVVLGSTTNAFDETIHLLNYGFGAFERITLLKRGEPVGRWDPIIIGGTPVDVVVGRDVLAAVRKQGPRAIGYRFVPDRNIVPPVVAGMKIGTVEVRVNRRLVAVLPGLALLQPGANPSPSPSPVPSHGTARPTAIVRALLFLAALIRAALNAFL